MKPQRKVTAGGLAAAVSAVVVWLMAENGLSVPPPIASSITTIIGFAAAWLIPDAKT